MKERRGVKIALVNPPTNPKAFVDYQKPLVGLAYLAAVLEQEGYSVAVIDCPPLHMTYADLKREITGFEPEIVGITSVTATFPSVIQTAHTVKELYPETLVVLGGPHATFVDEQILDQYKEVDVIIRCEGEETILEIANYTSSSDLEDLDQVAGITFRRNGRIVRTPDRPFIQDLDQLPRPAWEHFPLIKYRIFGKLILPVLASRGCPYSCTFCTVPGMCGVNFRARSPEDVVDELEWLRDTHGADAFSFSDELFTYDLERVFEICEEIERRDVGLPWDCQTRVDRVSRRLLTKMRAAGCQLVSFGVESGAQKILDAVNKRTTVEQSEKAVRWAKEAGLLVSFSVIMGYPGETVDTLNQTLDLIRKVKPDDVYLYLATPFPGTELRNSVEDLGWEMSQDWSHYELQTPAFQNPLLSFGQINNVREKFYNQLYSPSYILRQSIKGTFYSKIMAETALHQLLWRIKLPWISANFKKLMRL